jgi:glutathione S-transferase
MKLYGCPGACSLAPHIALRELNLDHQYVEVDIRSDQGQSPEHLARNPLGAVPVLELDDGQTLTEVAAILQYLADQRGSLAPPPNSFQRYRLQEWLSLIGSEIHKCFFQIFYGSKMVSQESARAELGQFFRNRLRVRWQLVADRLAQQPYLLESGYSVADIYLYVVMTWWVRGLKEDFEIWPSLLAFIDRMEQRPAVQAALKREDRAPVGTTRV